LISEVELSMVAMMATLGMCSDRLYCVLWVGAHSDYLGHQQ